MSAAMTADMTWFALLALGLVSLSLMPLVRTLRTASGAQAASSDTVAGHRAVLQAHWAQLAEEHRKGQIDDTEQARARDELMRRMLEDEASARGAHAAARPQARPSKSTGTTWALTLGLPLLVLAVYSATGSPQAVNWRASDNNNDISRAEMRDVEDMIGQMVRRLQQDSNQKPEEAAQAWAMVAQTYASLQRFSEAEQAYARASELRPNQPQWLADRADMLAMVNGQNTQGEPDRLIQRALELDPQHLKSLALAGSAAYNRQDMDAALGYWRRARALTPEGGGFAAELDRSIAAAQAAARKLPQVGATATATALASASSNAELARTSAPTPAVATAGGAASAGISGTVVLSAAFAGRVQPTDSVFVLVRAIDGPRAPLAVTRHTVADLPLRFALTDSQAMTPELRLSRFERVEVLVRISPSGNAVPRSGDLFAQSAIVGPSTQGLALVIDRQVP